MIKFVTDKKIYDEVILARVPATDRYVWIGTADIKDMHDHRESRMAPFLDTLSDLINRGVSVRLIHAKEPGPRFREDFDKRRNLYAGLERMLCPRVHFKCVVVDGTFAYTGSANLTGAGMVAHAPRWIPSSWRYSI